MICFLFPMAMMQYTVSGFVCLVNDFQKYNQTIQDCNDVKTITFNVTTPWNRIPLDLIDQTKNIHSIVVTFGSIRAIENKGFCSWPNLESITAEKNNITTLPAHMLDECRHLTFLSLASNNISEMYDDVFHGLAQLIELDLSNNQIERLSDDVFKPLKLLKTLRLIYNQIEVINADIFEHNHKLNFLDLSYNQLQTIQDGSFWKLDSLDTLDLSFNANLQTVDISGMDRLRDVFLQGNLLKNLHIPEIVVKINAVSNIISQLTIDPNGSLDTLDLRNNSFRDIGQLSQAVHLTYLDISNNNISEIDFSHLMASQIQQIIVTENPIRKFNVQSLTSIESIRNIEITLSNLDNQTRSELIRETKKLKIRLFDPNDDENHSTNTNIQPVTPVSTKESTTTIPTTRGPISSSTSMPIANDTKDDHPKSLEQRITNIELSISQIKTEKETILKYHNYIVALLSVCAVIFSIHLCLYLVDNWRRWKDQLSGRIAIINNRFSHNPRSQMFNNSMENINENSL